MKEIEIIAEKVAESILPHHMDEKQKKELNALLIEFAQAIVKAVKEDHAKNYWP